MMMNVLVVDVGGTNVKILATGHEVPRKFPSGARRQKISVYCFHHTQERRSQKDRTCEAVRS